MKFNYYYGAQADQFSFVRIPRIMLTGKEFQVLSMAAKMLYGVLLDRMNLSMKNGWFDEENRVYIIYHCFRNWRILVFCRKSDGDVASLISCMLRALWRMLLPEVSKRDPLM